MPQSLILCGFPGKKNYVKYASGWKNHKKMIKYDTMIQQKIISEKTKHQPCFYTIHTQFYRRRPKMNVQEFQNKLKEIQTIAKANGNSLTAIQIRDTFAGMELDKTQLLGVLKYLTSQGIQIEGMEDSATEETKEPERKKIPLTPEEETYLRNYLEELPELSIDTAQAFAALANGDQDALQSLTSYYMKETAKMAADMNAEEIFLADLIQEANLALIQALGSAGNEVRDEKWLMNEVRKGIITVLEEQTQRKFADDSLVARVEKLESAVRELNDDEDDKNAFSIDELAIILDMKVDEIRDVLRLTGDDK